ncbi:MAG: transposase [Dehalococcoidia bacterium]|nr:transposase [Dehalococcoidia bacterium]
MDARQEKGLLIAATSKIERNQLGLWKVPSQAGNGISYVVNLDHGHPFCSCPDFEKGNHCKHLYAVEYVAQRETKPDGTIVETQAMRVTYAQNWPVYDTAQMRERERFVELLRDLCNGIPQPPQTFGRPKLALSDVVFGIVLKVYSTVSGRRVMSELREAEIKGLVCKSPSFASTFRYLEKPELTPLLKVLIEQSASPLKAIESDFAVDSSGFATTTYNRWYDAKWGKMKSEAKWIKAHLMTGVKTHVVTSVEVTATETADAPQLPDLVKKTAETFTVKEVSADKAYSSKKNLRVIDALGATPYIPFKNYSLGKQGSHGFDCLWDKMWHFYNFNKATFMQFYHKRSNVETTLSMIKSKFGASVRAKTPVAQVNEVLCKILCHNICVLVQSIYELRLEPTFWTSDTEEPVVPEVALKMGF